MLHLATLATLPTLGAHSAYRRHPDPFDIEGSWQGRKKDLATSLIEISIRKRRKRDLSVRNTVF